MVVHKVIGLTKKRGYIFPCGVKDNQGQWLTEKWRYVTCKRCLKTKK